MKKIIEGLRWKPLWVTHLGCIKGCLEYLNLSISSAWLFGATGHAFIINVHEEVCPSGPTAWKGEMLLKLGRNIGYNTEGIFSLKTNADFETKQQEAWEHAKRTLDRDIPCYGWELEIPEYYVIYGYDDTGYYFSGAQCDSGKGPKPWKELGESKIGCVELYSIEKGTPADDATTVKQALTFIWEHARSPEKWIFPKYKAGLAGYDLWIRALQQGKADGFGVAFNAAVWNECRHYAIHFLEEAKERLGGPLGPVFDETKEHYEIVSRNLKKITETFPFHDYNKAHITEEPRVRVAIDCLTKAREAEASGLAFLEKILKKLQ
jgi:hypothetical protein